MSQLNLELSVRSCRAAQILTIPFATAHKPICSLFSAPVFSLMCWTCLATVLDEQPSTRAMALFVSPSNAITCTSLGVSLYCWASWQTGQDMIVQLSGVCSPVLQWMVGTHNLELGAGPQAAGEGASPDR